MKTPLIICRISLRNNGQNVVDYYQGEGFGPKDTAKRFDAETVASFIESLRYQHPRDAMRVTY